VTDAVDLERRYRRLLAWYPAAYRRENEQEMLAVLLDGAREGQRRPGLADTADLIRNALWMHLRPSVPRSARTVLAAVRLMCLGAALEVAAQITFAVTGGRVGQAMLARDPAQWQLVHAHIVLVVIGAPVVTAAWLLLARAIGRGIDAARLGFGGLFCLYSIVVIFLVRDRAALYATADLISAAAIWTVALAAVALIFHPRSRPYFAHEAAQKQ
jgi:hypothetical protein